MAKDTTVITGGNGFVGRHLVNELLTANPAAAVVVWDQEIKNLSPEVTGSKIDITDPSSYTQNLKKLQPSWLVHLAALAPVPLAIKKPKLTHQVNVVASRKLFETIRQVSPATKVLAVSSADIYGFESATPLSEQPLSKANPLNPYSASKLAMEQMIESEFNDFILRVRPFPHIGPGQGRGFVTADFTSQIAAIEAEKQEPIILVGNLNATRDFTDVRDVVRAYRLLMETNETGQVYHVASGQPVLIKDIVNILISQSKQKIDIKQDKDKLRPAEISVLVGDASLLKTKTGWQPTIPLNQTLLDILNWWRLHFIF